MKRKTQNAKRKVKFGFTLIEILVVAAIIATLAVLIIWPYASFRDEKLLDGAAEDALSLLHEAQTRTLSSDGGLQYGVSFENDKITLLPDNKEVLLHDSLVISSVSLAGGGTTVTFKRLTGVTDQSGAVTISLTADSDRQRVIAISAAGSIGLK